MFTQEKQNELGMKPVGARIVECIVYDFQLEPLKALVKLVGFPDTIISLTPINLFLPIETNGKIDVRLPKKGVRGLAIFSTLGNEDVMDENGAYGYFLGFPYDPADSNVISKLQFIPGTLDNNSLDGLHKTTNDGQNTMDFGPKGFVVSNGPNYMSVSKTGIDLSMEKNGLKLSNDNFSMSAADGAIAILGEAEKTKIASPGAIFLQSKSVITDSDSSIERIKTEKKVEVGSYKFNAGGGVDFGAGAMRFSAFSSKATRMGSTAISMAAVQGNINLSVASGDFIVKNHAMSPIPAKINLGIGSGVNFTILKMTMLGGASLTSDVGDIKLKTYLADIILDAMKSVSVKAKVSITIDSKVKMDIKSTIMNIDAKAKMDIKAKAQMKISSAKIDMKGDTKVTIDAPMIELGKGTSGILTQANNPILCPITGLSSVPVATIKAG